MGEAGADAVPLAKGKRERTGEFVLLCTSGEGVEWPFDWETSLRATTGLPDGEASPLPIAVAALRLPIMSRKSERLCVCVCV